MAFGYVLANLLADNDRAAGALFLDPSGETVEYACAAFAPYDLRVLGAYLGIYLRQLERLLAGNDLGVPRLIHIDRRAAHIYAAPLPDGYCVALVQHQPGLVAHACASLADAADQLRRELF
ncbi:MAG TPA: hypothetical protein VF121_18410 [Thermoanaerobaculia bacterium]|nr:hypothetical protein [Thermoanaerobaculia bacterium]